jgi:hypothetical protein
MAWQALPGVIIITGVFTGIGLGVPVVNWITTGKVRFVTLFSPINADIPCNLRIAKCSIVNTLIF